MRFFRRTARSCLFIKQHYPYGVAVWYSYLNFLKQFKQFLLIVFPYFV